LNAAPKATYQLDVGFSDIPAPAQEVQVFANYRVENACVKPQPISGAVLPPEHQLLIPVTKVSDQNYQTIFHLDALIDENYFELGVCQWRLQNVSLSFTSPTTKFLASLSMPLTNADEIAPKTEYFLNRDFSEKPKEMNVVFGEKADFYLAEMGPTFSVSLVAKKEVH
jgi:hypothetical protein